MSLLPLLGKKKLKNRYSERRSISLGREKKSADRPSRRASAPRARPGIKSLLGLFSAATMLAVCAAAFIAVAVGLIFVYRWATSSDYFALRNIEVHGINNLSYTEVLTAAEVHAGRNSLDLSLDAVEARLVCNPCVSRVSVKRALPDGLIITIQEHEPRYWTLSNGHMYYADSDARLITKVNSNKFLALPILEIDSGSEGLARELNVTTAKLAGVMESLPADYHPPALFKLSRASGMEVQFEGKNLSLLLGLENIDDNIRRMLVVLKDLKSRDELEQAREIRAHDGKVWVIVGNG